MTQAGPSPEASDERLRALELPAAAFPPLRAMFAAKPAWEAAVARLEALAQRTPGAGDAVSPERIMWRVSRREIEPYLQRLTPTGWTRGRKLCRSR